MTFFSQLRSVHAVSVVVFQIRANRRRELKKLAIDTALKEFAEHRLIPGTKVAPLGDYV